MRIDLQRLGGLARVVTSVLSISVVASAFTAPKQHVAHASELAENNFDHLTRRDPPGSEDWTFVGYRKCPTRDARTYIQAGNQLVYLGNRDPANLQLGPGVYIGRTKTDWPEDEGEWTCLVWIKTEDLEDIGICAVPEEDRDGGELWDNNRQINGYIRRAGISDYMDAIRTSWISYPETDGALQLCITPGAFAYLHTWVECYENSASAPTKFAQYHQLPGIRGRFGPKPAVEA